MQKQIFIFLLVYLFSVAGFSQEFSDPSRTELKNDAGQQGSKSGFFQTENPANFPNGATSWWHLLDIRHTNANNNFAMQFSGSFWDQNLYFRKTSNNPSQLWSKVLLESNGNVNVQGSSINIGTGANIAYRAGAYFTAGNMSFGNTPYISFNALLTTSDIPSGTNAFTPAYNPGGGVIISGEAGGSGLHFLQKDYANGTSPYNLNSFTENFTLLSNGNVGIGTSVPQTKLNVVGQSLFSRDGWGECCSSGNYTLAIAENTAGTGKKASISFHNGGFDEGKIELSRDIGYRSVKFYDNQGLGLGIDVTGKANFSSKVGIGGVDFTRLSDYALAVNGTIVAKKIKVSQTTPWPDYVFHPSYELRSLSSLEAYINQYNHLPEVPSANEIEKDGLDLGATQAALLKKIEELTLYVIKQGKELQDQQLQINQLKQEVSSHIPQE